MKTGWYNSRAIKILTHIAVWAVVLSLPYLLDSHHGMEHRRDNGEAERAFFYLNSITNLLWVGVFYLNANLLAPRLFSHRRYLPWSLTLVLVYGTVMAIHLLLFMFLIPAPHHFSAKGATGFLLPAFVLTIAIGTTVRVVRDKLETDKLVKDRQAENLKTELSFLRSQINPHFIFNILNNLVALEQLKSPELGPTIMKLSSLMQYMLYETDEERVSLAKEVDYLQSYIDLQRQRFGNKVPVTVNFDPSPGLYEIEPMLLIPFVENAFKHGVGMIDQPAIEIRLEVSEGVLYFMVRNRYNGASSETRDKGSGIGLGNVRRRLNLLYRNQQILHINKDDGWFTVFLELNLH
jgi:two-component system LytT family sensor kinase